MMLEETEYHQRIDELQQQVEDKLETVDFDVDMDNANGVLTIEFENGSQIILSRQSALRQLWVAARSGGYHLDYNAELADWLVVNGNEPFHELLQRLIKEQVGELVDFDVQRD
ncbi:iron donor protein CyaY [Entomomonas sp. E2T0]|uniref:iron donor protein CyaY n=1 Tax=Entomomonas sp. E2T0 TaxID=2930213 RepID=UPI0022285178|nr:iron donor protein CyaY [Entomomonas sp. E2T0]UYZ84458.1 iron donor protein CyaY [Entomomonas sp. E2T0]